MDLSTTTLTHLDLDPAAVHDECVARGYRELTDEQVFELTAGVIALPKQDPANSFTLHAPLELLARRALLRFVTPERREAAREQMIRVAATYERAAEPADPVATRAFPAPAAARAALIDSVADHDLEGVDAAAGWLARHATAGDVMALAGSTLDSLAAAGHASIYFLHLARTATGNRAALGLLRPLVREIARLPELRIEWIGQGVRAQASDEGRFTAALANTPRLGLPGSDFIFPTVHQVDAGGHAREIIAPTLPSDLSAATRAILRVAARSMLQDDPVYAPYGWSHCLTLPQSALGITPWLSSPATAAAIAATYVVAFRAAQGGREIDLGWEPEPTTVGLPDALIGDPAVAASATFHATEEALAAVIPELASRAASHDDAHLAKYTLACLDAAAEDPGARRLYLAAAAYLGAWWANH